MARGLHNYSVQQAQNAGLGQAGSIHVRGTGAVTASEGAFVAITFLEETAFADDTDGLIPETLGYYPDSDRGSAAIGEGSSDISANGVKTGTETFPAGLTIYGRWTAFKLASGGVIAYIG
tara:strand:- start:261 stop:620 length:360 start_codon:yes stop_codon:yes gene_type:complete